jgi:hypothetical protein
LTLNPDKLELLSLSITIIEEQFLAGLDDLLRKNSNAMIAVHHEDLSVAVGVDRVIGESDFVALASRVDDKVVV